MEPATESKFTARPTRGTPLSMVFLSLVICATVFKVVSLTIQDSDFWTEVMASTWIQATVAGAIIGGVVGSMVGFLQDRPIRSMLTTGTLSALLLGLLAPAIYLPEPKMKVVAETTVIGATLLIGIATLLRWLSGRNGRIHWTFD